MLSISRRKDTIWDFGSGLDSTYVLIHEAFASLSYSVLPFWKMYVAGLLFFAFFSFPLSLQVNSLI
jgi:hypothetical protein